MRKSRNCKENKDDARQRSYDIGGGGSAGEPVGDKSRKSVHTFLIFWFPLVNSVPSVLAKCNSACFVE